MVLLKKSLIKITNGRFIIVIRQKYPHQKLTLDKWYIILCSLVFFITIIKGLLVILFKDFLSNAMKQKC